MSEVEGGAPAAVAMSSRQGGRPAWLLVAGVALLALLLAAHDAGRVFQTLADARFGILLVVLAHLPQTLFAALGWRALLDRDDRPRLRVLFRLRWIKEAVNALLPVAQVGGDVVRAKLASSARLPLRVSAASCIVDVVLSTAGLIAFAAIGLAVVVATAADPRATAIGLQAIGAGCALSVALVIAHKVGALRLVDKLAARCQGALGELGGLHQAVSRLGRERGRLWRSAGWHLTSWSFGVVETYVAMWVLGLEPTWEQALIIESLGQAVRALGFAIPGALGVQEGGYILICGMFGIPPEQALALSLMRRVRELILGAPGLISWRRMSRRPLAAPAPG